VQQNFIKTKFGEDIGDYLLQIDNQKKFVYQIYYEHDETSLICKYLIQKGIPQTKYTTLVIKYYLLIQIK